MNCLSKKTFLVYSPVFQTYDGYPYEPPEYGACAINIEAENSRDAISLALKTEEFKDWILESRDNDSTPFAGVKAELTECPEGFCCCSNCNNFCSNCSEARE